MKTFTSFAALEAELDKREQEEKEARLAAYDARYAAAFESTADHCASYNAIENALEDAFDQFAEQDECCDTDRPFTATIGRCTISITEIDEGFEIELNGKACIIDELVVTNSLVRYFLG